MSDDAEFSKSGWRFVALFRFEQTNQDGKKVFFNFQEVPASTSKKILSIFRQHSDLIEFYDEPEPNKPASHCLQKPGFESVIPAIDISIWARFLKAV